MHDDINPTISQHSADTCTRRKSVALMRPVDGDLHDITRLYCTICPIKQCQYPQGG
jgi:hypothetical protein